MERERTQLISNVETKFTGPNELNDSVSSEFSCQEEKSVSQKIFDQPNISNRSLINTLTALDRLKGTHNSQLSRTSRTSKIQLGVNFTRNESTEVNSKRQTSFNQSHKSNTNSPDISFHTDFFIPPDKVNIIIYSQIKKTITNRIKTKDNEYTELYKKYDSLKRKTEKKKEELSENKSEFERLKHNNINLKKMIISLIKQKEEK